MSGPIGIELVHERNHVWRLVCQAGSFFLKTHTKSWYAAHGDSHAFPVIHESGAWRCLGAHRLATPEVVAAEMGTANPLGRPFLLTRELAGQSLGAVLRERPAFSAPLRAVGDYLRRMHAIAFTFPGYVSSERGPTSPLQPGKWRHRCWTVESRQKHARDTLEAEAGGLSVDVRGRMERAIDSMPDRLRSSYEPPRFVHGDCHANTFFLVEDGDEWHVTGTVDMEVASAGDAGEDLMKLCVELAALLPASDRWWEALFDGYGATPEFDHIKLRLLGMEPTEFAWIDGWPKRWNDVAQHIFDARSWKQLLDLG
ncbi:MAG: aminoglycoside phosphotransferase family protein [Chloroflexi bacterium]|nr:aminoglycoside phosphotransferase family protein [Chloroflexota bacterium]